MCFVIRTRFVNKTDVSFSVSDTLIRCGATCQKENSSWILWLGGKMNGGSETYSVMKQE